MDENIRFFVMGVLAAFLVIWLYESIMGRVEVAIYKGAQGEFFHTTHVNPVNSKEKESDL